MSNIEEIQQDKLTEKFKIPAQIKKSLDSLNPTQTTLDSHQGVSNPIKITGSIDSPSGYYKGQINPETHSKEGKGIQIKLKKEEDPESFTYYEGYFSKNKFHGPGYYLEPKKIFYQGNWENGKITGEVVIKDLQSHYEYNGQVYDGLPHGLGTLTYKNGYSYSGEFKNFLKHGKGVLTYANGDKFKGNFLENFRHGFGIMKWVDGNRFKGEWSEDKMHGRGYYEWRDGSSFNGNYVEGKKEGYGVFNWANGNRYEGFFVNGKQNGRGIIYTKTGKTVKGIWEDGMRMESQLSFEEELMTLKNRDEKGVGKNSAVIPKLNLEEEDDNDLEVEYPEDDSDDSMRFADHFSEVDERAPMPQELFRKKEKVQNVNLEEAEKVAESFDSLQLADEFSECNERNFIPEVGYYQQEEIEYVYEEVNTDSEENMTEDFNRGRPTNNNQFPIPRSLPISQEGDKLPSHRANDLHEEVQELEMLKSSELCSKRIPDEGNIKVPNLVTRNLKPLIQNNSEKEFQGFSLVSNQNSSDLMKSGLFVNKVVDYNPKRKDHQPFFFERVKKFFSLSLNDKYLVVLKEWTVMKIDIQSNLILDEIEFRQHNDDYYDNDPLPEPTNIYYSKKSNDLIIFFKEYRLMDYKVIDLDDMTRSTSKKFNFEKKTEIDFHLQKIYREGRFEIRYLPNNFRIMDEIYFKIFKPAESECSDQTDEDEMVFPPVLISLDYHTGNCKNVHNLSPYSDSIINYPFIFPDLDRIVNLNFNIGNSKWSLVMKNLQNGETLIERSVAFSLDDMLSSLVDLGDSRFYTIDRVKSYLFEDRYFIFFVETDIFQYRLKPWIWDLDREEIGMSLFVDLKTGKNKYKEVRFDKTNDRRCTIGVFRREDVGELIFNLPQRVEDENWIRYEEWGNFIQIYKIYEYDKYKGGYLSSKVVKSAFENKPIILIDEKTSNIKYHCHSVFQYKKGEKEIDRLTDIQFKNYQGREQEEKLEIAERYIEENKNEDSDDEDDGVLKLAVMVWENDELVMSQE